MKEKLTAHVLVRDEINTIAYAIGSTAPWADRVLVTDTGSVDGTWELLKDLQEIYPNLELLQDLFVPDSRGYRFDARGALSVEFETHDHLCRVRNEHIKKTKTEFSWVVDGDEVYPAATVDAIYQAIEQWPDLLGICIKFSQFAMDYDHIGIAPNLPVHYGRVFRTDRLEVRNPAPHEQHYYGDTWIGPGVPRVITIDEPTVHHYQLVYKPWRRKLSGMEDFEGPQPSVLSDPVLQELTERHRRPKQ